MVVNLRDGFWESQVSTQMRSLHLKKCVCNQHEVTYMLILSLTAWPAEQPHFTLAIYSSNCRIRSNLLVEVRKYCVSWHVLNWNYRYEMEQSNVMW